MAFCKNCGSPLNEGVKFCPNCGTLCSTDNNERGTLTIKWDGMWMLVDAKIHVRANGTEVGVFSFKKGFEVTVPITNNRILVDVKFSIRSYQPILNVNPSENYTLYFVYSRMIGGFDFILVDKNGKRIQ